MKKRIYSLLLAAIMVFSLITTAFAAEGSDTTVIDCGDGYFLHVIGGLDVRQDFLIGIDAE